MKVINRMNNYLKLVNQRMQSNYFKVIGQGVSLMQKTFVGFLWNLLIFLLSVFAIFFDMIMIPLINYILTPFAVFFKRFD